MEDDSPGTPLGRLKAIGEYAETLGHSPLAAKPPEVFLIEEMERLRDIVIYLDIIAKQAGIDLGEAVMNTFNAKSKQVGSRVYLAADDWHYWGDGPMRD